MGGKRLGRELLRAGASPWASLSLVGLPEAAAHTPANSPFTDP